MRGHQPLIAMRMAGRKPRSVSITMGKVSGWVLDWNRRPETVGDAEIEIQDHERVEALDLRFLVGIGCVRIIGQDDSRTAAMIEACKRAGAGRVVAALFADFHEMGYAARITDTETENG